MAISEVVKEPVSEGNVLIKKSSAAETSAAPAVETEFEYDGKKYPKFVANKGGTVGIPIKHPQSGKTVARLIADFAWSEDKPFLDHLDLSRTDETNIRTKETHTKRANLTRQNAGLFEALVQQGMLVKLDDDGTVLSESRKDRAAMLAIAQEVQSDLIDAWLGGFSVERMFPEGEDELDILIGEPDSLHFLCKIGEEENPAHVIKLEVKTPTAEARRNLEDASVDNGQTQQDTLLISTYTINNRAKIKFARKYIEKVEGVVTGPEGEVEFSDQSVLKPIDAVQFKSLFNPHWLVRVANAISDAFNRGGK